MLMGGPRAGIQLTGHLVLYELEKAQPHIQNTIRPLPWLVWDVDVGDCSCAILTSPLPPPQDPQSVAEEEVWCEVRLPDHLPQHGGGSSPDPSFCTFWGLVFIGSQV